MNAEEAAFGQTLREISRAQTRQQTLRAGHRRCALRESPEFISVTSLIELSSSVIFCHLLSFSSPYHPCPRALPSRRPTIARAHFPLHRFRVLEARFACRILLPFHAAFFVI